MTQQSANLINCASLCRPLLTTSYEFSKGDQISRCIQLPYIYHLNDIKNLENYLCKSIKIIGIDFLQKPIPFPKLKYKNIMISSSFIGEKSEKIEFQSVKNYEKLSWIIDIVISQPQNSQQTRTEIKKKLAKSIHFYNLNQDLITESLIPLQKLKKSKINCIIKRQQNKKQQKLFKCRVPVRILLPSLKEYKIQNILHIICEDLSNAIDIMIKNSMMYRITLEHQNLIPIQNFFKSQTQVQKLTDSIFRNLSNFNERKGIQEKQKLTMDRREIKLVKNEKMNDNSNTILILTLIFVLIALVGGYGYIKFY